MPCEECAKPHVQVEVLVAINVPRVGTFGSVDSYRIRLKVLKRRTDTVWQSCARSCVSGGGRGVRVLVPGSLCV